MKRLITYMVIFFMTSSILSAQEQDCCQGAVSITGKEFVEKDGNVYIKFTVAVDGKEVDSKASIRLTPEIEGLNNNKILPAILINGKTRKRLNDRWLSLASEADKSAYTEPKAEYTVSKKSQEVIQYEHVVPYESWMSSSNLTINEKVSGCAQNSRQGSHNLFSGLSGGSQGPSDTGIIGEPYKPNLSMGYTSPEKEKVKKRDFQGKAYIDFPVGSSAILADFRNNPSEIAKINADISNIKDNSDFDLTSLKITGYASPEGSYASNERLSQNRTAALKKYLENIFNFPHESLKANSVAEDWVGFREALLAGNMAHKDEILAIIDSEDAYDRKEQRLKGLAKGAPYAQVLKDIFPSLRRVEYQIDYIVKDYGLEESKLIYGKEANNLSELELYNLARTYTVNNNPKVPH